MIVLIKLLYAGAITALLILLVAFGVRVFYEPPEQPEYPGFPIGYVPSGPVAIGPDGKPLPSATLAPEQNDAIEKQREYQTTFEAWQDDIADYHRAVFLIASLVGVVSIAGGVVLKARFDAIRLGLVGGGLGTILYAVAQAEGDLDEGGPELIFGVAAVGLVLILGTGYRWLAAREDGA